MSLGFDTHASLEDNLNSLFDQLNGALDAFSREMKAVDLWNNVTLIETSDFSRTLNPNGGDGTDHAWGGNHFMMGKFVLHWKNFRILNISFHHMSLIKFCCL